MYKNNRKEVRKWDVKGVAILSKICKSFTEEKAWLKTYRRQWGQPSKDLPEEHSRQRGQQLQSEAQHGAQVEDEGGEKEIKLGKT